MFDVGGGQFQRQGQAIQFETEFVQEGLIVLSQREVGIDGRGCLDEEAGGIFNRKRSHAIALFGAQVQALAAGDEDAQPRTCGQQFGHQWRRREDVLEIVERQQHLLASKLRISRCWASSVPAFSRFRAAAMVSGTRAGSSTASSGTKQAPSA